MRCGLGPAQHMRPGETTERKLALVQIAGVPYDELADGVELSATESVACVGIHQGADVGAELRTARLWDASSSAD